jgi:hypothetical protein
MAVTASHLLSASDSTDATSYATASITPVARRLVLAWVGNQVATGTPNVPTLSGNGLNWVQVATVVVGQTRLSLFRAMGLGPTPGAVSIDFAGQTQITASWSISQFAGVTEGGTDGSAAVVQAVTNSGTGTTLAVTLAAFASTGNATVGGFRHALAEAATAGTGFAILGQSTGATPVVSLASEFRATNDTGVDATWSTSAANLGIAAELAVATSDPVIGPTVVIEPPDREPWRNGLTQTVPVVTHDDDRFVAGVGFSPLSCTAVESLEVCDAASLATDPSRPARRLFQPFVLVGRDICSPVQWQTSGGQERAREHLTLLASKVIESELATAAVTETNPHFASASTTILGTGAQTPEIALALLVQAIADGSSGVGVIHARPKLVAIWAAAGLIHVGADGILRTVGGTPVVAGSGYTGTGPNGEAVTTTSEWAYATDNVAVHIGPAVLVPDNLTQSTDRTNNILAWRVEMGAVAVWGGCLTVAVEVNPTASDEGGLTNAQLRADPVPVSGPLTDAQLRASAVPVSAAALPLPTGAATAANQPPQATIFKTVVATAVGDTLVHDTTAGLKFRLLSYEIVATANAATAGGALVEVVLRDAAANMGVAFSFFAPAVAGTVFGGGATSGWVTLGAGILSGTIANDINVNLSAALTSGEVRVVVGLREE